MVSYLAEHEQKSASGDYKGVRYTTTATSRTTMNFDESGIKKALGARIYNKLTSAKLDRAKLQEAIESGTVDAGVVSQHTQTVQGATTLRLTKKAADEPEG